MHSLDGVAGLGVAAEPDDFDDFWLGTLHDSRAVARPPKVTRYESPLVAVDVFDVRFSGFAGDEVAGWLLLPRGGHGRANDQDQLPLVVEYLNYGAGRGLPHERLAWASCGYAWFVMDNRGQGSGVGGGVGNGGSTADPHGSGPALPGFLTRGILNPADSYYRRLITDAVLAVDALAPLDRVDASRIAVVGASQGGGVALAAAGLSDRIAAAMIDVPFLCDFQAVVGQTPASPYHEVAHFLANHRHAVDTVFRTLSYLDGVNMAKRARVPALFSVGMLDPVCPPASVFAARDKWGGSTLPEIRVYGFNGHEGGGGVHFQRQVEWLDSLFGGSS